MNQTEATPEDLPTNPDTRTRKEKDLSDAFQYSRNDAAVADLIIDTAKKTPKNCINVFKQYHHILSNYGFWYLLSVVWSFSNDDVHQDAWGNFFGSDRDNRFLSVMKRNEQKAYRKLPSVVTIYWPHEHKDEWMIAYTTDEKRAKEWTLEAGVKSYNRGAVSKEKIIAYFNRKRAHEVIVLQADAVQFLETVTV